MNDVHDAAPKDVESPPKQPPAQPIAAQSAAAARLPAEAPAEASFAETALKLGGKSEEEARRMGAIDRADDQVEQLFQPQYQTTNSPIHRAVWERHVAGRVVRGGRTRARRPTCSR